MLPRVLNKHKDKIPPGAVYVGRPSKWGNPFTHLDVKMMNPGRILIKVATREEAIQRFTDWVFTQPELIRAARAELRGKDLWCFCAPLPCHAYVWREIANS